MKIDNIIKLLETDKEQAEVELIVLNKQLKNLLEKLEGFKTIRLEMYEDNKNNEDYAASLAYSNAKEMLEFILKEI